MKRILSCLALAAVFVLSSGDSAQAFWRTRIVYRPAVVRTVVVTPAPVVYAPVMPVSNVVYRPAPVVYTPAYYAPAYYVPAVPAYYAPVVPVTYGW